MGSEVCVHLEDPLENVRNGKVRWWEVKSVCTWRNTMENVMMM